MDGLAWVEQLVGNAALGDRWRTRRLVDLTQALIAHPVGSLPSKLSRAQLKGAYRLCAAPAVTQEALIAAVRAGTFGLLESEPGPFLLLHDTADLDYTFRTSLRSQLGHIGDGRGRGYLCHSTVALTPEGRCLGLVGQLLWRPEPPPPHETRPQKRERNTRLSRIWLEGIAPLPDDPRCIDVCDRGGDTFEFLAELCRRRRRFVIRAQHNRRCWIGHEAGPASHQQVKLFDYLRQLPSQGSKALRIGHKPGRPARTTTLNVSFAAVQLLPPHAQKGQYSKQPLKVWVVRLWEPDGKLERFLLVGEPVTTVEKAIEAAGWYEKRWVQEEWHKCLKSGCGVEALQFTDRSRLEPMIMILSVVATWLLRLRDAAREPDAAQRPATEVVPEQVVRTLRVWRHQDQCLNWSLRDFCLALGRLGGHQNRRSDGLPGWITLWRGYERLACMLDYQHALEKSHLGQKRDVG